MTTPTFNRFKSTTIYGNLNNLDYTDSSGLVLSASGYFQRNLTVGGDITSATGNIKGKKLYYNNVDIATTYATNASLTTEVDNIYLNTPRVLNPELKNTLTLSYKELGNTNYYPLTISNTSGTLSINTLTGSYPITFNASNFQLTINNGTNYYDVLTTNTGAKLTGTTFTGNVSGLTATTSDNSTLFASTAFVKAQNYLTTASLSSSYALISGATFTGNVSGLTATTSDNSTKFATTAFVKAQNYITTNPDLTPYALKSGATFTGVIQLSFLAHP